jgi:hypothetical protein
MDMLESADPNDLEDLDTCKNLRQASSILFQAVYTVFTPIIQTIADESFRSQMDSIFPKFDEKTMSFYFYKVNKAKHEKQKAVDTLSTIREYLDKMKDVPFDKIDEGTEQYSKETLQELNKHKKHLVSMQLEQLAILNKYPDELIEERESDCSIKNEDLKNGCRLYFVLEDGDQMDDELVMKRLPVIGSKFHDPEDESVLDKYAREEN